MSKVYIVGAGPGDPELITVKGLKCIQTADVILYDRLINEELLNYAKKDAELIFCGKLPNYHSFQQETINRFLVNHAKKGKVVTRLKGGDPFVFGRGGEEAEYLAKNHISFEIVPGITSSIGAAAYAGIPLTHRNYSGSVAFVTGHRKNEAEAEIQWGALAKGVDTLAVYMGIKELPNIVERLIKSGKSPKTPVALIHWGTTKEQKTLTGNLGNIVNLARENNIQNPTMIIIGEVVLLREQIQWFEHLTESDAVQEVL